MSTMVTSTFKSRDGIHDICYHVWFPETEPKAIVQIAHGMCEHSMRYKKFAEFLCGRGFIVCANDHLGHGDSVRTEDELGYFAEKDGWETTVKDMHSLTRIMKKNSPSLPYFLFGHSMGSFLARAYTTWFGSELEAVIYCGTAGPMKGTEALLVALDAAGKTHDQFYRSEAVRKTVFGSYNKKIREPRTESDWLSRDERVVDAYISDPKCGFNFTINGFENLGKLLWFISQPKWFSTVRKDLPILLIAGDADPVGAYGKGVTKVYEKLTGACCDAHMKLYAGARHELINETCRNEVFKDISEFFEKYIGQDAQK